MNSVTISSGGNLNTVERKFQEVRNAIRPFPSASLLWDRCLTPDERSRLGGDCVSAYHENHGTAGMWATLRGCSPKRAVVEVAHNIGLLHAADREWLLREIGEHLTGEDAYEDAIGKSQLVLNEDVHEAFWRGEPIDVDWTHEAMWSFFWELARHAKAGRPVDAMTFGNSSGKDIVSKRKSRLTEKNFPVELAAQIQVVGRGTQQLMLPQEEIRIFQRHIEGEIREWLP